MRKLLLFVIIIAGCNNSVFEPGSDFIAWTNSDTVIEVYYAKKVRHSGYVSIERVYGNSYSLKKHDRISLNIKNSHEYLQVRMIRGVEAYVQYDGRHIILDNEQSSIVFKIK